MRTTTTVVLLFFASQLHGNPPQIIEVMAGKVVSVVDGDTVSLQMNRTQTRVHLEGIDAPEWNQGFGERSKRALSDLLLDKIVVVKKTGEDRYGRTLGIVIVDGVDVNAKMIESGLAWHYKRYNKESRLAELETLARRAKRGLWADPDPLPPWEFRIRSQTPNGAPESSDGETLK